MLQETANYVLDKTQTLSPLPSSLLGIRFAQDNNLQPWLSDQDPWLPMASEISPCEVQNELSPAPEGAEGQESTKGLMLYNVILGVQAQGTGFMK